MVARGSRPATVADVHELAMAMPHAIRWPGEPGKPPIYQVGGKSFVFFRNPRPDAVDPVTGERYDDVIVFWVADEAEKRSLVENPDSPFFTTPHFDGHLSVLLRGADVAQLSYAELAEVVQDAWLSRASRRRAAQWLEARELDTRSHAAVQSDDLKIFSRRVESSRRRVDSLAGDPALRGYHLVPAVRADLLACLGRAAEAREEFERAAALTANASERAHLLRRAAAAATG